MAHIPQLPAGSAPDSGAGDNPGTGSPRDFPTPAGPPGAMDSDEQLLFGAAACSAGETGGAVTIPSIHPRWLDAGQAVLDATGVILNVNDALAIWLELQSGTPLVGCKMGRELERQFPHAGTEIRALEQRTEAFGALRLRRAGIGGHAAEWFTLEVAHGPAGSFVRLNSILPPLADLEEGSWDENLRSDRARRDLFVRLLRAEAQLQTLTERWPGVIFSQRADLSFRFVSPRIEELTGIGIADWTSRPQLIWQAVHESDADDLRAHLKVARQTKRPVTSTYRIRHAQTGRVSYVLEHRHANVSPGGLLLGYEGVWLDVTRQTIAEKRLSSAAWRESLSVLTMGLAHDFSNVMAGIHALSETFLDQVGAQHEFTEGLTLIKRNAHQASQLVHRIINLHQGKIGENSYYNLNELAADLGDLVRKIIPRKMQFAMDLSPEQLPVYLDPIELRQVVINLVLNAIEATSDSGSLVLRTVAITELPATPPRHGISPRLPAVCLTIEDNGRGIRARHLPSVFDPFFTTKSANKGSGLGLYNARLFVEKHRGAISVESSEGAGSKFRLWLPQADFTEAETEAANRAAAAPMPRDGTRAPHGSDGKQSF